MKWSLVIVFVSLVFANDDTVTVDTVNNVHLRIKHSVNFRDPKDDSNKVDWWVGAKGSIVFDSLLGFEIRLKTSMERDNGRRYYQHSEKIGFKYGYVQYYEDTEDGIQLLNITGHFVFWDILRVGGDFAWDHWEEKFGVYAAIKWKWFFTEIVFWDQIYRIRASLEPTIPLGKRKLFVIGADCEVIYVDKLIDWNAGYSIGFKVDMKL